MREGNPADVPGLPDRAGVGYQGAGADRIARLRDELVAAGGRFHPADGVEQAVAVITGLLRERNARRVLVGDNLPTGMRPALRQGLTAAGIEALEVSSLAAEGEREAFFTADAGISGADRLIAETGTVVVTTRRDQPRSLTLLVPVHLVIAGLDAVLPDLFDLFEGPARPAEMPSCLSLITGPSKTGDIELKLVTGVHGPGEVHLVFLRRPAAV